MARDIREMLQELGETVDAAQTVRRNLWVVHCEACGRYLDRTDSFSRASAVVSGHSRMRGHEAEIERR